MQADLSQSQQLKHSQLVTDGSPASGSTCIDSRDSDKHDGLAASQANTTTSSHTVGRSKKIDATTAVSPASSQPSRSHAGFTPFAKNPEKQKRYEAYMESLKTGTTCKKSWQSFCD